MSRRPYLGSRTTLAAVNDKLSEDGRWLHPTKGFRTIGAKRSQAIADVAEIKSRVFSTSNDPQYIRWMPHQGLKERARRRAQMAKLAAKGETRG